MTTRRRRVTLRNKRGLHARASARFVEMADRFDAEVTITKDDQTVTADSVMELLMLVAGPGTEIEIGADGSDAEEAVAALAALVEDLFGEGE